MKHEKRLPKSKSVLGIFFHMRDTINQSEEPLTAQEISEITGIKIRSTQRYLMRLASERLVDFRAREREDGDVGTSSYEYAKVGHWNSF